MCHVAIERKKSFSVRADFEINPWVVHVGSGWILGKTHIQQTLRCSDGWDIQGRQCMTLKTEFACDSRRRYEHESRNYQHVKATNQT